MKKYLYIALAALGMMGCSDDTFEQDGEGVGYLRLELGKVDVELSSLTKAEVTLPDKLVPEVADFTVDIKMGGKSVDGFPKPYSDIIETGGIELKAGTYTVIAYHGKDEPIQTEPYFEGSSTVQINPGQATPAEIDAALANAMLLPAVNENLQKHYSDWTLTAMVGDASLTLADDENAKGYLFVQAERAVNAAFEGTNLLGNKTTHEWTVISSAAKQTRYVIKCDPDLSISFGLKAVAEHTTDNSGYLNGTKVSLSFGDLSNVPVSLISDWKATLVNASGEVVRSYSTSDFSTAGEMTIENAWPYLPQGNYTLRYSYTIDGETVSEENTEPQTVAMPQPTFTVEVSGSTSYSVYVDPAQGAAVANTKDGSSIFDITASASIAPEILRSPNYSNLLKVIYTTDSGQNSGELSFGEAVQFNSLAWQKHALSATVSFDGVEQTSSPVDCHVTGLPYAPEAMVEGDWKLSYNSEYSNGLIQLGGGTGNATATSEMAFYIPDNIGVQLNTNVTVRAFYWWVSTQNTTFTVNVNGTTIISQYSDNQDNDNTGKNYSLSGTSIFSPGACEVRLNSSYTMAGPWSKVHSLHILYN